MIRSLSLASLLFAATASAQQTTVPLYTDLGSHQRTVSSKVPQAQQYFNQGLRLVYGFNHGEAIRSFTRATQLDPSCTMCWWGIAYAYGPHVNAAMDSASGVLAHAAARKAVGLAASAQPWERDYAAAIAARYAPVPPADRSRLDSAYARAMQAIATRYPDDLDAASLYAESMMDLRPWNYWTPKGQPYAGTQELVKQLERVIARNPNHPGACHFYIHAVEAVNPQLAVPCAERLAGLMPGVGHMVHMPAHIYIRVGRWKDAVQSNHHAIHTDEVFIDGQRPEGLYPLGYYPHNIHFLAFASTMAGLSKQAIEASKTLASKVNVDAARQFESLQEYIPYHALTLTTFGKWDDVLALKLPPADTRFAFGMAHYARGVAYAAKGNWPEAQVALDTLKAVTAATKETADSKTALSIAVHALMGEIADRHGQTASAVVHYRQALALEDAALYIEPPKWHHPMRHALGGALLKAGQA
ncbi:MAG: hypothetical protein ABIR58_07330, partial [Gemmatimonadaceae bacterium]